MKRLILLLIICSFALNKVAAQITISDNRQNECHYVYKNKNIMNDDDIYETHSAAMDLCVNQDGAFYLRFSSVFNNMDKILKQKKIISRFFLSNTKEGTLKALNDLSGALQSLQKKQHVTITDFTGKTFVFFSQNGKGNIYYLVDSSIPLRNGQGKDYDGFSFDCDLNFLQEAISNSDKWE